MDNHAQTVPNFLRHYTPDLVGGSVGYHLTEVEFNHVLTTVVLIVTPLC